MKLLGNLMIVALGVVAVACGGSAADPVPSPTDGDVQQGDEQDLTKTLSQGLLCAAVTEATANNNSPSLPSLAKADLKGDALADFKAWQKGMVSDYPSEAFTMPVKFGKKTYSFILVIENNDGGGSMGIYRTNGSTVATISGSESGDWTWSAPADKCPDQ